MTERRAIPKPEKPAPAPRRRIAPKCLCGHPLEDHVLVVTDIERREGCQSCGLRRKRGEIGFFPKCPRYRPARSSVLRSPVARRQPTVIVRERMCVCGHKSLSHRIGDATNCKRCSCAAYAPIKPARKSAPARTKRPRCANCGKAEKIHADMGTVANGACAAYAPKRKTRSDKKPRGMKDSDLGKAKRTLWAKFRAYVYRRDGNVCFTCDRVLTDEDIRAGKRQAGHMFPGRTGALLFDPLVVFVQDAHCNKGLRGNTPEFVRRYVERFGIEQFQAAVARTSRDKQWRTHEVRELIAALNRDPSGAEYEALYMEKHGLDVAPATAAARGIE